MIHVAIDPAKTLSAQTGRTRTHRRSNLEVFAWPLLLGLASLLGLVLGLTGDGARDIACWVLLGLAPLTVLLALARPAFSPKP